MRPTHRLRVVNIMIVVLMLQLIPLAPAMAVTHAKAPLRTFRSVHYKFSYIPIKTYALYALRVRGKANEYHCLNAIYTHESHWNSKAFNPQAVDGWHAGGIPQVLGLDPKTSPYYQIDRGLKYIGHRYHGSPCRAWEYWKRAGSY